MNKTPPHIVFFACSLSFLAGIVFAGLGLPFALSFIPAGIVFAVFFATGTNARLAFLAAALLILGEFYYVRDDVGYRAQILAASRRGTFQGIVVSAPERAADLQSFYLKTEFGKILVETAPVPAYFYGDSLSVEGAVKPPPESDYGKYLATERVAGTIRPSRIARSGTGGGNPVLALLFRAKERIRASFSELFKNDQAALFSGITMGANENISKEFSQNLSLAGVRHLTAINGLHMTI